MIDVKTTVDLSLLEGLDFEPVCEHPGHGRGIYISTAGKLCRGHVSRSETAEWILEAVCVGCEDGSSTFLCDAAARQILESDPVLDTFNCGKCGARRPMGEWLFTLTPLKEKS